MKSFSRLMQILCWVGLMLALLSCSASAVRTHTPTPPTRGPATARPAVTPTRARATSTPAPTSRPLSTPTPPRLQLPNKYEGLTVKTVCLETDLSFPKGKADKTLIEFFKHMLGGLGLQVTSQAPCDATLKIHIDGEALCPSYSGAGSCCNAARVSGEMTFVAGGRESVTFPLRGEGQAPTVMMSNACIKDRADAPFDGVWSRPVMRGLGQLWGVPAYALACGGQPLYGWMTCDRLFAILRLPEFELLDFRVQQYAIWTIVENPRRDEFSTLGYTGANSSPSAAEFDAIRRLLESAGLKTDEYLAFRSAPAATSTRIVGTPTVTRIPPTPTRPPTKTELKDAAAKGTVKFTIKGRGLESIDVTLESANDDPLEVSIEPGTIFLAQSAGTQNMVVRQPRIVLLKARGIKVSVEVKVACANMHLGQPDSGDAFLIKKESTDPDLIKLLSLPDFTRLDFRVQQFAIWTITDNPPRNGYVGLGYSGAGSGPTAEEFDLIRYTFESAGIATAKYQALR